MDNQLSAAPATLNQTKIVWNLRFAEGTLCHPLMLYCFDPDRPDAPSDPDQRRARLRLDQGRTPRLRNVGRLIDNGVMSDSDDLNLRQSRGFTLVEMAIAISIAAVLGYIAMNNFSGMTAKAKTRQAQLLLTKEFMAERTFFVNFQSYTNCLDALKALPHGSQYLYFTGILTHGAPSLTCGHTGTVSCDTYDFNALSIKTCSAASYVDAYGAQCSGHSCFANSTPPAALTAWVTTASPQYMASGTTFKTVAAAVVTNNGIIDIWTIDDTKTLLNPQSGL
jgi:type IV pilus assembly protein PilA